ncbi:MAG: hypothetical protein IT370_18420 [Deltaproteobacteria bacterium]|nr:hypothetical protein [Deltaproteobacteria bacterium]
MPTDVVVLVVSPLPIDEVHLIDQDGALVAATSTTLRWNGVQDDSAVELTPLVALQPAQRYRIELLSRFTMTPQVTGFVTAAGAGVPEVQAPQLTAFMASEHLESTCSTRSSASCYEIGPVVRLDFEDPAPGVAFAQLEVRNPGDPTPTWIIPLREARWVVHDGGVAIEAVWRKQLGGFTCAAVAPLLWAGQQYCATLAVRDAVGRVSRSNQLCATVDRCRYDGSCTLQCGAALVDAGPPDAAGRGSSDDSEGCSIVLGTAPRRAALAPTLLLLSAAVFVGLRRRHLRRLRASS